MILIIDLLLTFLDELPQSSAAAHLLEVLLELDPHLLATNFLDLVVELILILTAGLGELKLLVLVPSSPSLALILSTSSSLSVNLLPSGRLPFALEELDNDDDAALPFQEEPDDEDDVLLL